MNRGALALFSTILFGLVLGVGLAGCQASGRSRNAQPAPTKELSQAAVSSATPVSTEVLSRVTAIFPTPIPNRELSQATPTFPTQVAGKESRQATPAFPTQVASEESRQATAIAPTQVIWEMLGEVNKERALKDLRRLTGEEPICVSSGCYTITNRLTGSEGLHLAMDYISENLVSLGYSVEFWDWSRSGEADRNLIARKTGVVSPTEEIYFVAHVDGVGGGVEERLPAADDDASGAVDALELARILSSHSFGRTVVLLFSTGEEQGTLGVQSYLAQLSRQELSSIQYVVDVDMVGYDGDRDRVMELWHGGHSPSLALAEMMSETIRTYQLDLVPTLVVGCG